MSSNQHCLMVLLTALFGLSAAALAENPNSRHTPIVRAVQRTRSGIVALQIEKNTPGGGQSVGTGVIVDERGYVVTSEHLTRDARRIRVRLSDGSEWNASVVAEDPASDLAVLRIRSNRTLQALPLGSGNDLLVGETIVAIGHPYGCGYTVSQGIVSALEQEITMPGGPTLTGLIQTDASINPGNSGGPLLNINGEWIGLTVALRENARGIAYALNINTVKRVLSKKLDARLLAGIDHGLQIEEVTGAGNNAASKVVIASVHEKSNAQRAGLLSGDEIRAVSGRAVASCFDVERALWDRAPGDRVTATVLRDGAERSIEWLLVPSRNSNLSSDDRRTATATKRD
jgi:serine protease Do